MKISKTKIEMIMAEKKLSTTEFAKRSGISRQSISTVKQRGTCTPTTAGKLADGLGVPVSEIFEQEA